MDFRAKDRWAQEGSSLPFDDRNPVDSRDVKHVEGVLSCVVHIHIACITRVCVCE